VNQSDLKQNNFYSAHNVVTFWLGSDGLKVWGIVPRWSSKVENTHPCSCCSFASLALV